MDALPDDLILKILRCLDARPLIVIGALSSRFRMLASKPRFSLAVTDRRLNAGMKSWIQKNATRIKSLSAARCSFGPGCLDWARDVPLTSLRVLYGRIAPSALECICPDKLQSLVIHQIAPDIYHEFTRPRLFSTFTKLRSLDITLSTWEYTEIGGLESLTRLEHLGIRNAYMLHISSPFPPNLKTVYLKARYLMVTHEPLPATCNSISLECDSILPLEELLGSTYPNLHTLHVISPLTMRLGCLARMPALRALMCKCQMFIFGQDEWIAASKSVRVANIHASLAMCTDIYNYDEVVAITTDIPEMRGTQCGVSFDIKAFLLGLFV
jgi:hypothetical protein